MTKKEIKQFAGLYGLDIIHNELLLKGYKTVSIRKKTIPTIGTPCYKIDCLTPNNKAIIKKVILHKDNSITLETNFAFTRYWN